MKTFYAVYCGQVVKTVKARSRRHAIHRVGHCYGLYQVITAREYALGEYWK